MRFQEAGAVSILLPDIKDIIQNKTKKIIIIIISHFLEDVVLTNQLAAAAALTTALSVNSVNKKHPRRKITGPASHATFQIDRLK